MLEKIRKLIRDETGATAIEYGLIAALVSVGLIGVLGALGGSLRGTFETISTSLEGADSGG